MILFAKSDSDWEDTGLELAKTEILSFSVYFL